MELKEIVFKLIGPINPIGETNEDNKRFENLKIMCDLINDLIQYTDDMAYCNKDHYEFSRKRASDYVYNFLTNKIGIAE
jgi:hypothetical protein